MGATLKSGPLSTLRERGPDLTPSPIDEFEANICTMNYGRSVDAKRLQLRIL